MTLDALIVLGTAAFALLFVAAWIRRPDLRQWLEQPKYGFHDAVRGYDRACHADAPARRSPSR